MADYNSIYTGEQIDDGIGIALAQPDKDAAQDAEIANVKSAFDYGEIIGSSAIFERGSFSSKGLNSSSTKRLRTIGYIPDNVKSVRAINGYQLGVYCYYKSNNTWAGFVYTNGNVGTDTSQFTFRTTFDFDDPAYSAYNFRLLCAGPNVSSNITVDEASNYILAKDGAKSAVENALENIPVLAYNAYIKNEVGYGNTVSLLPITYSNFVCAVCECKEGDVFTVTGAGGVSGRLWSFVDSNNALLSAAGSTISVCSEIIIAPANSAKVIFNASTTHDYNFTKGNIANFSQNARAQLIRNATVRDFPNAIVRPTIAHKFSVNEVSGVSDVKGTIYRNGNDFCIIYNENLNGNTTDLPSVSGTGMLAIKYKFFHYENGVESNVSYGEIARKGTTYTTWDNESAQFEGGCGVPSGINGIQYFSSAYTGTKRYNNIDNYGLRPCACEIAVSPSGVTFGEIKELSLTINGEKGAFDVARIDPSYEDYNIYYTTTPPCKVSDTKWWWMQPVIRGIAVFKSTNGIDWTLVRVTNVPYQPQCEVTCVPFDTDRSDSVYFAARTWEKTETEPDVNIYIGRMKADTTTILSQYKLQSVSSRGYLTRDDKGALLFYNPTSYDECTCLRLSQYEGHTLFFHKWFTLYKDCTWYVVPDASSFANDYTTCYIVGNNGNAVQNRGLTFMELSVGASPKTIADMSAGIE